MKQIEIKEDARRGIKKKLTIPESWNELTQKQLLQVAKAFCMNSDVGAQKLSLVNKIFGISWPVLLQFQLEDLVTLNLELKFLYETPDLTKNLIPFIKARGRKYYGCDDNLNNFIIAEFIAADSLFITYQQTHNIEMLNKLIAVIYRPKKKNYNPDDPNDDGDIREPFNGNLINKRSQKLNRLSMPKKLAILFFYIGCRTNLENQYPEIFNSDEPGELNQPGNPNLDLVRNLDNSKFGTIDQIEQSYMHNVFYHVNQQMAQEKRRKTNEPQGLS